MKITEARIKTLIAEEKEKILLERKIPGAKTALTEIALMSAQLHDKEDAIKKLSEKDLLKLKSIAESLDIIFYNAMSNRSNI